MTAQITPVYPARPIPRWCYTQLRPRPEGLERYSTAELGWEFACRLAEDRGLDTNHELITLAYDVQCIVEQVIDVHWNRFSRTKLSNTIEPLLPAIARVLCQRRPGQRVGFVELGCGSWNPMSLGFTTILAGLDFAYCVDSDAPSNPERAVKVLADAAAMVLLDPESILRDLAPTMEELIARLRGFDLARLRHGDAGGIDGSRLFAVQRAAEDTGIAEGSIGLSHSTSFLEHVADLDAVIAELARITCVGGVGVHIIDAVDHRMYDGPEHGALDYLGVGASGERVQLPRVRQMGDYDMNRVRPHEVVPRFEQHGFEILEYLPIRRVEVTEEQRARFDPHYRAMRVEELEVVAAIYRVRKR